MVGKSREGNLISADKPKLAVWCLTNNPKRIYEEFL